MGKVDGIFISTNKVVLDSLIGDGIDIRVVYPKPNLKGEYMKRYRERGSHQDFIDTLNMNWDDWLAELEARDDCKKHVLSSGEYITDALPWLH